MSIDRRDGAWSDLSAPSATSQATTPGSAATRASSMVPETMSAARCFDCAAAGAKAGVKPTADCYKDAKLNEATAYQRVIQEIDQLKGCLADGYPFVFGFSVYSSFSSHDVATSGIAPMPAPDEQLLGGHAVLAVGYNDETQRFLVRNSWGTGWGQQGYFELPYAYLTTRGLASDFWTIRVVT